MSLTHDQTPYGFCGCGCGQKTKIATRSESRSGHVKGQPFKYIRFHGPPPKTGRLHHQYNGGLHFHRGLNRWTICCRDGTIITFARGMVMADLRRSLAAHEVVHHLNGDPTDDRLENLALTTRADHMRIHRGDLEAGRRRAAA